MGYDNIVSGCLASFPSQLHLKRLLHQVPSVLKRQTTRYVLESPPFSLDSPASSIQSLGSTCETLCIGHNSVGAKPRWISVTLPTTRAEFLSQRLLRVPQTGLSANSVLGRVEHACVQHDALTGAQLLELIGSPPQPLASAIGSVHGGSVSGCSLHGGSAYSSSLRGSSACGNSLHGVPPVTASTSQGKLTPENEAVGDNFSPLREAPLVELAPSLSSAAASLPLAVAQPVGATLCEDALAAIDDLTSVKSLLERQRLLEVLFENRYASVQRLIAFLVIFHRMGKRVQNFWDTASVGVFSYDSACLSLYTCQSLLYWLLHTI
eukprot:6213426-Pleurochrysis_carterae.AAC.3